MKTYFSKRHSDALRSKSITVSFPKALRVSIARILDRYSDMGGWNNEENFTFESVYGSLCTFYGKDTLDAFDENDKRVPASVMDVVRCGYPTEVIDVIEAWFDAAPRQAVECERELNDLLTMNGSPWRFVNGEAILVDSDYLYQEVQAKTLHLLKEGRAFGGLEEFQGALQDLQSGETKDAIIKAHKSVESVMKRALNVNEHLTFGSLLARLVESGLIPEYYREFLVHFEKLALGAVKERNLPGRGHGQGIVRAEVPRSLAEFALNLAGAINLFVIQRWIETREPASGRKQAEPPEDEVPF